MTTATEDHRPELQQGPLALFMDHRTVLVEYAGRILRDRASGEDVVQEAWLKFEAVAGLRFLDNPVGYLYQVVRNLALDGRRRRLRESLVVTNDGLGDGAELTPDGQPTPDAVALHRNECARVLQAMAELPERTRIALEMHRLGGAKLREIAVVLGISVPLAHILVADGVRHCKRRLGAR